MSNKFNKSATKVSLKKNIYVKTIEFEKIVPWSDTENITVREKIERESGVVHWSKQVGRNEINFGGSCLDFIYLADNGMMAEPDSTVQLQEVDSASPEEESVEV
jgi:hypothetical protein